jgi:hypothetical protein
MSAVFGDAHSCTSCGEIYTGNMHICYAQEPARLTEADVRRIIRKELRAALAPVPKHIYGNLEVCLLCGGTMAAETSPICTVRSRLVDPSVPNGAVDQ